MTALLAMVGGPPLCVCLLESELRTSSSVLHPLWEGDDGLPPQQRHGITQNHCVDLIPSVLCAQSMHLSVKHRKYVEHSKSRLQIVVSFLFISLFIFKYVYIYMHGKKPFILKAHRTLCCHIQNKNCTNIRYDLRN